MVEVTDPVTKKVYKYSMDGKLHRNLKLIKQRITTKDFDYVMVIDGEEGAGKSVLAMQIAKFIDPSFNLNDMSWDGLTFVKSIMDSKQHKVKVFDEAFTGLSARKSLSQINNMITSLIMEMRQRNLFVIIVLPTVFMLDPYIAKFRARSVIHVYTKKGKRGRFVVFNKRKKNVLIDKGKKTYSYNYPKTGFYGRFTDKYTVDEAKYRELKSLALRNRSRLESKKPKAKTEEKKLWKGVAILAKHAKLSQKSLHELWAANRLHYSQSTISRRTNDFWGTF